MWKREGHSHLREWQEISIRRHRGAEEWGGRTKEEELTWLGLEVTENNV